MIVCVLLSGCAAGAATPAAIRLGEDACGYCRMTIVSTDTVAQIVSPGAEPIMIDDIGCLQDFLAGTPLGEGAVVFVADHRTHEWIEAGRAVFTRTSVPTPMSSGLLAHADPASRDADPAARGGTPIAASAVFGPQARRARP